MIKRIFLILFCIVALYGEESKPQKKVTDQFVYLDLGLGPVPIIIPQFGMGYRLQSGSSGLNVGIRGSSIVEASEVKLNTNYLYYIHPNREKQNYIGVGLSSGLLFLKKNFRDQHGFWGTNLLIGKEYISDTGGKRFFEADITWPIYGTRRGKEITDGKMFWFPCVIFSYGWGF